MTNWIRLVAVGLLTAILAVGFGAAGQIWGLLLTLLLLLPLLLEDLESSSPWSVCHYCCRFHVPAAVDAAAADC